VQYIQYIKCVPVYEVLSWHVLEAFKVQYEDVRGGPQIHFLHRGEVLLAG
jgi:hypothetical protein